MNYKVFFFHANHYLNAWKKLPTIRASSMRALYDQVIILTQSASETI